MTKPKDEWQKRGHSSKLDEAAVLRLRELARSGALNVREAAGIYGVATETIRRAVRGDTFTNLQAAPRKNEQELEAEAAASQARFLALLAAEREAKNRGSKLLDELDQSTSGGPDAGYTEGD